MRSKLIALLALTAILIGVPAFAADGVLLLQPNGAYKPWGGAGNVGLIGGVATAVAPTIVEGAPASMSFDLNGNLRVAKGYQDGGEHIGENSDEDLGYQRTVGGKARSYALMTDVLTNTSSSPTTLPAGSKTFFAKIVGTGAQSVTVTIYGDYKSTATELFPICELTPSGTSEDAKKCTAISEDYDNYHAKTTSISGGGAVNVWAMVGIGGASGGAGGGDASAANQTTIIGHVDGLEGGIGAAADAAATAGSTGSISAKLRFLTSILDTISTTLSSILTALQLIDDDQTGTSNNYLTSAANTNETEIKATAGRLLGIQITNVNAAARYFRCSNLTAANTTPGSSTVFYGTAVPGNTTGDGFNPTLPPQGIAFSTALTCWLTTGLADTDTAGVAANELKWNIQFK